MFTLFTLSLVVLTYLIVLFALGFIGDKYFKDNQQHPIIYTLALGVHCTSWAFFGTTTQAAIYGWGFVPTYLGIIMVMLLGFGALKKVALLCHQHNVSSLADFIGLQFQRSHLLAALVSILCFIGITPYVALQLESVSRSVGMLSSETLPSSDFALHITGILALFAILFGTRSFNLTDKKPGLMLAVAFAAVIKLGALLSVGLFVCYAMFDGVMDLFSQAQLSERAGQIVKSDGAPWLFISHVILGICAMFCLPRQFHINFVENNGEQELRTARWLFPIYLGGMTLFVLPIAMAGHILLPEATSSTDTYALALPMYAQNQLMTLVSFIGGLAAAISMVMVATLSVGIMVSNNLITPLWLKLQLLNKNQNALKGNAILQIRRLTIILVLAVAYFYHKNVSSGTPLVNSGIIAMALLAQTMPLILLSLWQQNAHKYSAMFALMVGSIGWFYWLLWPSIKSSYYFDPTPTDMDMGSGFIFSLTANLICLMALTLLFPQRASKNTEHGIPSPSGHQPLAVRLDRLLALTSRIFKPEQQQTLLTSLGSVNSDNFVSPKLLDKVENDMAAQMGGASARILLSAIAEKETMPLPELVEWMEEASQTFQFNHDMLQSSVQHIQQGISVVDRDQKLIAWNQRYIELFDYPDNFICAGLSMRTLLEFNAKRGLLGEGHNAQFEIDKRIDFISQGSRYKYIRTQPSGKVIELNGSPLPGGGFVTTYSDITEYITIQKELEQAKSKLEERVEQRTQELKDSNQALTLAKQEAEDANDSKSKFLAAAGHDLMQPFNAASLYAQLIKSKAKNTELASLSLSLSESLSSAEELLSLLLDMTKLESGTLSKQIQSFRIDDLLGPLVKEFTLMARQKNLDLRHVYCSVTVKSDPKLLKRILQNLLSNAVRYTEKGKILIGAKRYGAYLRILVADTGLGISPFELDRVFDEFHQVESSGQQQGLGLGLTIVDGLAKLLDHPLTVRSVEGRGSLFAVDVPISSHAQPHAKKMLSDDIQSGILAGKIVLLAENEIQTREAVKHLLEQWHAQVIEIENIDGLPEMTQKLDFMLLDYHLDNGVKGIALAEQVRDKLGYFVPGVLNSASREEEVRQQADEAELYYLPKPLKVAAFKRTLRTMGILS